jgi:phosphopantothenoylcysteine decarboxylase/phosphopantothenate--cysteine ligase
MGFALARAAREAGAQVSLVAGRVNLPSPRGVQRIDVQSAQEMLQAVLAQADQSDVLIAAAAVTDWRPDQVATHKIKKENAQHAPVLRFVQNPDILATLAQSPRGQSQALFCVGFAAESQDLLDNATRKRLRKDVPLLVGNLGPATFGRDDNALLLVDAQGVRELSRNNKLVLARQLMTDIARRLPRRDGE